MRLDSWEFDSGILVQHMRSDLISGEMILHISFSNTVFLHIVSFFYYLAHVSNSTSF